MEEKKESPKTKECREFNDDDKAQIKFQAVGRATLFPFVDFEHLPLLEDLYTYLNEKPLSEWKVSITPWIPNTYVFSNLSEEELQKGKTSAIVAREKGEFSYFFYRLDPHGEDGNHCPLCKFVNLFLLTNNVRERISKCTGNTYGSPVAVFASCYTGGSFLHTHTDTGRGKLAFALNLTKPVIDTEQDQGQENRKWEERQGGCLQFLNWDYCTVKETVLPEFNSFSFFNVQDQGQPHRVTPIPTEFQGKRFSITGWFN